MLVFVCLFLFGIILACGWESCVFLINAIEISYRLREPFFISIIIAVVSLQKSNSLHLRSLTFSTWISYMYFLHEFPTCISTCISYMNFLHIFPTCIFYVYFSTYISLMYIFYINFPFMYFLHEFLDAFSKLIFYMNLYMNFYMNFLRVFFTWISYMNFLHEFLHELLHVFPTWISYINFLHDFLHVFPTWICYMNIVHVFSTYIFSTWIEMTILSQMVCPLIKEIRSLCRARQFSSSEIGLHHG